MSCSSSVSQAAHGEQLSRLHRVPRRSCTKAPSRPFQRPGAATLRRTACAQPSVYRALPPQRALQRTRSTLPRAQRLRRDSTLHRRAALPDPPLLDTSNHLKPSELMLMNLREASHAS